MKSSEFGKSRLHTTIHSTEYHWGHKARAISPENEITLKDKICKKIASGCTLSELQKELEAYPDIQIQIKPIKKSHKKQQIKGDEILKDVARDIVIQFFRRNAITNAIESHFSIFAIDRLSDEEKKKNRNENNSDINKYENLFGNVDIIVIPRTATDTSEIKKCEKNHIEKLERRHFIMIATFLDHGQTLNIGGLGDKVFNKLAAQRKHFPKNPFKQYLYSFCIYYKQAPNGTVMRASYSQRLLLLHETKAVLQIIKSKQMKAAATGCLGSVVYTTKISDEKRLGSHTLALNSRMNDGKVDPNNFVYLDVECKDLMLTNWLERLGCGRLWLETTYHVKKLYERQLANNQNVFEKYKWAEEIPEYQTIFKKQVTLYQVEEKFSQIKYNPFKYAFIFRLQDELLRAREIASGIGDKFYKQKGDPSYHAYLDKKAEIQNKKLAELEKLFAQEVEKKNSLYLKNELADREKLHFRDRVLGWADRVYKNDPDLDQMKANAFKPPYFKWKNEEELKSDNGTIKNLIDDALETMIFMRSGTYDPITQKNQSIDEKRLLQDLYTISVKQAQMEELQNKNLFIKNENEKSHLDFLISQLQSEIESAKKVILNKTNNDPVLGAYKAVNEFLPFVISLQNQYIESLLSSSPDDISALCQRYNFSIGKLKFLIGNHQELSTQVSERLDRNWIRHCLNAAMKESQDGALDTDLLDTKINVSLCDRNLREPFTTNYQQIITEYETAYKKYKEAMEQCKGKSDHGALILDIKQKSLQLAINEANPAVKYIVEAKKKASQPELFLDKLEKAHEEVKCQYEALYPLLKYALSLKKDLKCFVCLNDEKTRNKLNQTFETFWAYLNEARSNIQSKQLPSSNLLNNIIFEALKDYILLYQESKEAAEWKKIGFFEMENSYEVFFSMVPSLGIKGAWNTGTKFTPTLETIEFELSAHHMDLKESMNKAIFQKFLLERFSYYLNVACLEGCREIPSPEDMHHFEDLAKNLPNLAGILILGTAADLTSPSPFWTEFQSKMRDIFENSHTERKIYLPVKSGISGTAEIGVRVEAQCSLHEIKEFKKEEDQIPHYIAVPSEGTDIQIVKEISTNGGLTGGRYEKK